MSFQIIDYIFIGIIIAFSVFSFFSGFVKRMNSTIAAVCALIVAYLTYQPVYQKAQEFFSFNEKSYRFLLFALICVLVFIVLRVFLQFLNRKINDLLITGTLNRILGLLVGLLQSGIIVTITSFLIYFVSRSYAMQSVIIRFIIQQFM